MIWALDVQFWCRGRPATQGSLTAVATRGGAIVKHPPGLRGWRAAVGLAARAAGARPLTGPVGLDLAFVVARPRSQLLRGGRLRAGAPALPAAERSGDVDKLTRAVMDALTGVAYATDAQVVKVAAIKRYPARDCHGLEVESPGVAVRIEAARG